jgi:hypothetical protein
MDTNTLERGESITWRRNHGSTGSWFGDVATAMIATGAMLAGAALVADVVGNRPAEPAPESRGERAGIRSTGRLAEQMNATGWNVPVDLEGIVVVYPRTLGVPGDSNTVLGASAHVAESLGLARAHDHDDVLEIVRVSISSENQKLYGTAAERANYQGPVALFDVERESITFDAIELRALLRRWDSGEHKSLYQREKERMFAAVMNDIVKNLSPVGVPPGYRAIAATDPGRQGILPGDFPRISPEQFEKALDQRQSLETHSSNAEILRGLRVLHSTR